MTPNLTPSLVPPRELILVELGINITNLIATISPRKLNHYISVENWLNDYEPKPDATNIEKVSDYLEAFYHRCKAEVLLEVEKYFLFPLIVLLHENCKIFGEKGQQLEIWGMFILL